MTLEKYGAINRPLSLVNNIFYSSGNPIGCSTMSLMVEELVGQTVCALLVLITVFLPHIHTTSLYIRLVLISAHVVYKHNVLAAHLQRSNGGCTEISSAQTLQQRWISLHVESVNISITRRYSESPHVLR